MGWMSTLRWRRCHAVQCGGGCRGSAARCGVECDRSVVRTDDADRDIVAGPSQEDARFLVNLLRHGGWLLAGREGIHKEE